MRIVRALSYLCLATYPLWVAGLVHAGYSQHLWWLLCLFVIPQLWLADWQQPRSYVVLFATLCVVIGAWLLGPQLGALFYPVWMNLGFLILFASSLWRKPAIITRLARAMEGELSPAAVSYTEKVTIVWTLFFLLNGSIAWWTATQANLSVWTWYNGVIAYVVMALIFTIELGIRYVVKKRHH
ncbi:hypothetical protein [Pseudidiomarina homiensis]|uniref:COG4648 family protein n=1 Tax=Pseudidiomarina homiensis TaxID=364198 RepID=UPI00215A2DA7|nr:hypothetical protein [Pseudidiomarina homiensis]